MWIIGKYNLADADNLCLGIQSTHLSDNIKDIIRVLEHRGMKEAVKPSNFRWSLKSGEGILFWEDIWTGDKPPKDRFRKLYSISNLTFSSVLKFTRVWSNPNTPSIPN